MISQQQEQEQQEQQSHSYDRHVPRGQKLSERHIKSFC